MAPKKPTPKKAPAKAVSKPSVKAAAKPAAKAVATPVKHTLEGPHHHHGEMCCNSTSCSTEGACSFLSCCPLFQTITTRAFWASSLLAFAVVMAFDMWWHGSLLMGKYEATANMWRSMDQMQAFMPWCWLGHAALAMALSAAVLLMGRTCSWWGAFVSGVVAAAPLAVVNAMAYIHLPLADASITTMWAVGALLQGGLVGISVAAVKRCPGVCGSCCSSESCCK